MHRARKSLGRVGNGDAILGDDCSGPRSPRRGSLSAFLTSSGRGSTSSNCSGSPASRSPSSARSAAPSTASPRPGENSELMLGSRVGLVLSAERSHARPLPGRLRRPKRRASNPATRSSRSKACPCRTVVPLDPTRSGRARPCDRHRLCAVFADPQGNEQPIDLDLTLALGRPGRFAQFQVHTGEQHIEAAARSLHLTPAMLSVVDLFHILTYPFLLFAAWILHRRKREDSDQLGAVAGGASDRRQRSSPPRPS